MPPVENQVELPLFQARAGDPNQRFLVELLKDRGWTLAEDIERLTGWNERQIRTLAAASIDLISGQKGYKHIDRATVEEIDHCCNRLESQAKEMHLRALSIRRRAHQMMD